MTKRRHGQGRWRLGLGVASLVAVGLIGLPAAATVAHNLCAANDPAAYPDLGAPPRIEVWLPEAAGGGAGGVGVQPPPCADGAIPSASGRLVVALWARFAEPGGMEAIAGRLVRFGDWTDIRYWSVTRQTWRPLFDEAFAVSDESRRERIADPGQADVRDGYAIEYWLEENGPASGAVFGLSVRQRTPARLDVEIVNLTAIRVLLAPIVAPGGNRARIIVERESANVWRYFALVSNDQAVNTFMTVPEASYRNRALAMFRHVAGMPTDMEPPAAR